MTSIRTRLLMMLLIGLAMVLLAGGAAVYWIERASLLRQVDAALESRAHTLASLIKLEPEGLIFESSDVPADLAAQTYFELRDQSGKVLKRSGNLGDASLPVRTILDHQLLTEDALLPGSVSGRAIWHAFKPRIDPDDWTGHDLSAIKPELLVLTAAIDRSPTDQALATLLTALFAVGGSLAVTVTLLVIFGVRWALTPLIRLTRQLGNVSGHTLSQRFDADRTPRELLPVYRELNGMLDRVEQTLERERSFVDAAAHEFRTPLAELRTTAEVAMKWPDPERALAAISEIHEVGREMERLVESLLIISRAQAADADASMNEKPLASIIHGCIERSAGAIQEKRLNLMVKLDEHAPINMNGTPGGAMEIIVRNLIDNAVQYTPADGTITIREEGVTNGSPVLIVENTPVPLVANDLPRLFEPFWRRDGSRSDRQHAGLGLTVVQQIAAAVGLRVDAALSGDRLQMRVSRVG